MLGGDRREDARGEPNPGELPPGDELRQRGDVQLRLGPQQDLSAVEQRHPQLEDAGVERFCGVEQHTKVPVRTEARLRREVEHIAVADADHLRTAARSRGPHEVGQCVRRHASHIRRPAAGLLGSRLDDRQPERNVRFRRRSVTDQNPHARIAEELGTRGQGKPGIDRNVGCARLEHGQKGDHVTRRTPMQDSDWSR